MKELSPEKFDKILKKKHAYSKNDGDRENSPAMSDDLNGKRNKSIFINQSDAYVNRFSEEYLAGSPVGSDDMALESNEFEACNFIDATYFKR